MIHTLAPPLLGSHLEKDIAGSRSGNKMPRKDVQARIAASFRGSLPRSPCRLRKFCDDTISTASLWEYYPHVLAKTPGRSNVLIQRMFEMYHPLKLCSAKELKSVFGIMFCRQHIWRLEIAGQFPKRVRLGNRRVGWVCSEIEALLAARIEER